MKKYWVVAIALLSLCGCGNSSHGAADAAFDEAVRKHKEMVAEERHREQAGEQQEPSENQQEEDNSVPEGGGETFAFPVIKPIPPIK